MGSLIEVRENDLSIVSLTLLDVTAWNLDVNVVKPPPIRKPLAVVTSWICTLTIFFAVDLSVRKQRNAEPKSVPHDFELLLKVSPVTRASFVLDIMPVDAFLLHRITPDASVPPKINGRLPMQATSLRPTLRARAAVAFLIQGHSTR
jgi:hypothetical protein